MDARPAGEVAAELLPEIPHKTDVGAGEWVDRLPVVAGTARMRASLCCALSGREKSARPWEMFLYGTGRRVDGDRGSYSVPLAACTSGPGDHVLKINPRSETLLILGEDRLEDFQECEAARGASLVSGGTLAAVLDRSLSDPLKCTRQVPSIWVKASGVPKFLERLKDLIEREGLAYK